MFPTLVSTFLPDSAHYLGEVGQIFQATDVIRSEGKELQLCQCIQFFDDANPVVLQV